MANEPKPQRAGDNTKRLMDLYRTMVRIRAFEETALAAHKAGEIPGPLHVSLGQEAVAAGVCASLRRDDRLTSNHRGHGHAIAKGAEPARMMLEMKPTFALYPVGNRMQASFSLNAVGGAS